VRFQVFMLVSMKIVVFWVMPRNLVEEYQCCRDACSFHHQGSQMRLPWRWGHNVTSVNFYQYSNPEDNHLSCICRFYAIFIWYNLQVLCLQLLTSKLFCITFIVYNIYDISPYIVHTPNSNGVLVITVKLKAKGSFCMAFMFLFYNLQIPTLPKTAYFSVI
jgi:hypothetical protein